MQTDQKKHAVLLALTITNMAATIFIAVCLFTASGERSNKGGLAFDSDVQYTLYIGLNDKDTNEQTIPTERAKEIVNEICAKYVKGYAASDALGGWLDGNVWVRENTLVYTFIDAAELQIIAIMDETLAALNQNSILVEKLNGSRAFYDGKQMHKEKIN
jgi:hypothetical protein